MRLSHLRERFLVAVEVHNVQRHHFGRAAADGRAAAGDSLKLLDPPGGQDHAGAEAAPGGTGKGDVGWRHEEGF